MIVAIHGVLLPSSASPVRRVEHTPIPSRNLGFAESGSVGHRGVDVLANGVASDHLELAADLGRGDQIRVERRYPGIMNRNPVAG